jgi:hypothetical protein
MSGGSVRLAKQGWSEGEPRKKMPLFGGKFTLGKNVLPLIKLFILPPPPPPIYFCIAEVANRFGF